MQNFYLDIRKSLLHPWCVVKKGEEKNKNHDNTYEMYEKARSVKLDSLVEVLKHHLATDGAPAKVPSRQIKSSEPQSSQEQRQPQPQQEQGHTAPDKIIVFSYFPSAFWLIEKVSPWIYGCGNALLS